MVGLVITLVKGYAQELSYSIIFPTQMLETTCLHVYTDELYPYTYPRYQGSSPTKALSQYGLTATLAPRYQFLEVIPPYQATEC